MNLNSQSILLCALVLLSALSACTKKSTTVTAKTNTQLVIFLAKRAQACWFKGKDAPFKNYRLAAEVNSFSGKPRFLIVPKKNPTGLPVLVVQASKTKGDNQLNYFGPALTRHHGSRISSDLEKWAEGSAKC